MIPTVGRIVHHYGKYREDELPYEHAAIITNVRQISQVATFHEEESFRVSMTVFTEDGLVMLKDVPYSPYYKDGHWTWPKPVLA